jgi:hypothetical protein
MFLIFKMFLIVVIIGSKLGYWVGITIRKQSETEKMGSQVTGLRVEHFLLRSIRPKH